MYKSFTNLKCIYTCHIYACICDTHTHNFRYKSHEWGKFFQVVPSLNCFRWAWLPFWLKSDYVRVSVYLCSIREIARAREVYIEMFSVYYTPIVHAVSAYESPHTNRVSDWVMQRQYRAVLVLSFLFIFQFFCDETWTNMTFSKPIVPELHKMRNKNPEQMSGQSIRLRYTSHNAQ